MKNNKKFILAAGAAALGLVAATGVTSGFAWFTAANTVTVNGLNMMAAAEEGIVISNSDHATWTTTASAKYNGLDSTHANAPFEFIPASTRNLTNWYHGLSDDVNNGRSNLSIAALTVNEVEGVNTGTCADHFTGSKAVFLLNEFLIQSASATAITNQEIYVENVSVTATPADPASDELDKALRVGVKTTIGQTTTFKIFAPVSGATAIYYVDDAGAETPTEAKKVEAVTSTTDPVVVTGDSGITIPAYNSDGSTALHFKVYLWFEGEDAACKSANIKAAMDKLSITFKFGNQAHQDVEPQPLP